ncbi:DNA/RNA polymerases superfamily protein [Gossypium australe]|uniref:DNA/RNA polymerases superfamily protein n=1 Tax=Gossypium australe TaxID=47621 RepID=A0A5B6VM26_9ROSI|nr:DNA/RNA polymerases superfamily protein [Gossypium australe]
MYNDLKQLYWGLGMKRDISEFVSKCLVCQQVKTGHQVPSGLLQPVIIPKWKWDRVTMDFVLGLPLSPKKKDAIWVAIDRLTKLVHFIPTIHLTNWLNYTYLNLLDCTGRQFLLFWIEIQGLRRDFEGHCKKLWVQAFHLQTDGQSKRVIQILEDMLRHFVLEFEGNWERFIPLVEFAYNNSF